MIRFIVSVSVTLIIGLYSNTLTAQQFENVTAEVGIEHVLVSPVLLGGGAVFFDYNNDGWQDIFMTGGDDRDKLYKNINGTRFEDVSSSLPFIKGQHLSSAVAALDFNNDGCRDLFITTVDKDFPNVLLVNNCDGSFTNVSDPAGITHSAFSMGIQIQDVNSDGWQDIYVINYIEEPKFTRNTNGIVIGYEHECAPNFLYINNGTGGFTEVAGPSKLSGFGCGLAVSGIDFLESDKKGYYIANDFGEWVEPNELLVYGDSTVSSVEYGLDIGLYGMGIGIGDIDNDLDFDVYVTNLGKNALMINDNNFFTDQASMFNVGNEFVQDSLLSIGWGAFFADVDNDRDQDLYVSNGFVPSPPFIAGSQIDPSKMYENRISEMIDVTDDWGLTNFAVNRGAIYGDYNNDGFLDILVSTISGGNLGSTEDITYKLYRNRGNTNKSLRILLEGNEDKEAYGSTITAYIDGFATKHILLSSATHASQHEKILHIGTGASAIVDSVSINWSEGGTQTHYDLNSNQIYKITKGEMEASLLGCTDPKASNYAPNAETNYGCLVSENTTSIYDLDDIDLDVYFRGQQLVIDNKGDRLNLNMFLYNSIGQKVLGLSNVGTRTVYADHLSSGLYIVVVESNGLRFLKKIVKLND